MGELRLTKEDVGGLFVTRHGEIARIDSIDEENAIFPFQGVLVNDEISRSWTGAGKFFQLSDDIDDLIRRITREDADALSVAQSFKDL